METQVRTFYQTSKGFKVFTIFGYATKGIPSLEINGAGKLSKNIKEKLIFLTRNRKLNIPHRRFVICIDQNDDIDNDEALLKWLEFPLLLTYWYLAGLVPIGRLENCFCSGWIKPNGEIFHFPLNERQEQILSKGLPAPERDRVLFIGKNDSSIDSQMLLEHIPNLQFHYDYHTHKKELLAMTS